VGGGDDIRARIVGAVGEAGARELLDVLTRSEADRAALIGRLSLRADGEWLPELLINFRRRYRQMRGVSAGSGDRRL
jgi:hypothetical protein